MGHVEAIREKLVVNVVRRFLQSNDMPPSCNLLFESIFFSRPGPGFQFSMLSLLCTNERVAKCLLELFMWEDASHLLYVSRKSAVAL